MNNRFTILKTSWGISIFYEIEKTLSFDPSEDGVKNVYGNVFFKVDKALDIDSLFFLKKGIEAMKPFIEEEKVCFNIKVDYNITDFQPEGMYYMFTKWFRETNQMEEEQINVHYDKEKNRYIFPDLETMKQEKR